MSPPVLSPEFAPTLDTLHRYALAVTAIPRAHISPHPRWWHIGMTLDIGVLRCAPVPLRGGGDLLLALDLTRHEVVAETPGETHRISVAAGLAATEMGERLIAIATGHGLADTYERERFIDAAPTPYLPAAARAYAAALEAASGVLHRRRAMLSDEVSPVLMWSHHFDMSFEAYGTRTVVQGGVEYPTQINLGFFPGEEPYFYSSPWPFDRDLTKRELPHGATWVTEGWTGACLPYRPLTDLSAVDDFAAAVYGAAAAGLGLA